MNMMEREAMAHAMQVGFLDVDLRFRVRGRKLPASNKRSLFAQILGHLCSTCRVLLGRQVPSLDSATTAHSQELQT